MSTIKDEDTKKPSDEEMRKSLVPNPTEEQVIEAIYSSYAKNEHGVINTVRILKKLESYDDANYLVQVGEKKYLAKVHNGVESQQYLKSQNQNGDGDDLTPSSADTQRGCSSIDLQNYIFTHLNQEQYGIHTSMPVPVGNIADDKPPTLQSIHTLPVVSKEYSPTKLVLRLLEWVPGNTMSSHPTLPIESLVQAGKYLGKICIALDDLTKSNANARKAADRYHVWDGKNTLDLEKFVHCIPDENRKGLVCSVLESFRNEFAKDASSKPNFRKGILQADFNDGNIIMDVDGNVCGVIDFGDCTLSWRVLDVTVAMAYAMISAYGKPNHGLSAAAALLRGVHSVYPLTSTERKYLRLLTACRLCCSATLGSYSYQQNPENEYLLSHSEPAWKALETLWGGNRSNGGHDRDFASSIDELFQIACDGVSNSSDSESTMDCSDISFPDPCVSDPLRSVRVDESDPPKKKIKGCTTNGGNENNNKPVITFVTGNKKKLEEVKRILSRASETSSTVADPLPFLISNQKIDLPELQGNPLEIAEEKCKLAAKEIGGAVITEDTSLCFNALNGLPGPYIKWFLEKCGHDGLNDMIRFSNDKSAYAQTVVAFCPGPGKDVKLFDGRTKGRIVPPRGSLDFGWDPIFQPDEDEGVSGGLTYAEMSKEEKDSISHRSRSFQQLRDYLVKEVESIKLWIK